MHSIDGGFDFYVSLESLASFNFSDRLDPMSNKLIYPNIYKLQKTKFH